jgi:hypothetical protein
MKLHLTVYHGNHIFLHQSQIFYIRNFWHALSVQNNIFDSPRQGPPVGKTIQICVEIKKFRSIYLWKEIFFENNHVFCMMYSSTKICHALSVHNYLCKNNCDMWQPPAGPAGRQYYSRTRLYSKNQFQTFLHQKVLAYSQCTQ